MATKSAIIHEPVMLAECLECLDPKPGDTIVDATVGAGGHSRAIAERLGRDGMLLGMDLDPELIRFASEALKDSPCRWQLLKGNFAQLDHLLPISTESADGVLFDLGCCSYHLDTPERGFSFQRSGQLEMRYSQEGFSSAAELLSRLSQAELEQSLRELADEPFAARIAKAIVSERQKKPIKTTTELAEIVEKAIGQRAVRQRKLHPATRSFLALRLLVNRELENLRLGLEAALRLLKAGGRLVALTYHSGEVRELRRFLRHNSGRCICPPGTPFCHCNPVTRLRAPLKKDGRAFLPSLRGLPPTPQEIARNPRSRSARLWAAEKIANEERQVKESELA